MGKPKKRANPKVTSRVDRNLKELTLREAKKFVGKLPPPWAPKARGRRPHDARAVTVLCLMMVACGFTYDQMAGEMRSPYLQYQVGGKRLPSRSVLHRGMQQLSQKYVRRFNNLVVKRFVNKGMTLVVDSTGFRLKTSSAWYNIRIGRKEMRKDNNKLHIAIETRRNAILEFKITPHSRNDSPILRFLLRNIKALKRMIGDAGYPSRINCDIVASKNGKPFFCLKKGFTSKKKGSKAWRAMVELATYCKAAFDKIYHIRSQIEGVNSALKRRYGSCLTAIKAKTRNTQLALKVAAYNIKQLLYDKTARSLGVPFWIKCDR
jgi:hypothetical protein